MRTTISLDDRHAERPAGELVDEGDERPLSHTVVADQVELETIGMVEAPDWRGAARKVCVGCYEFYGRANSLQETSLEAHIRHFQSEQTGICGFSISSG